MFSSTHFEVHIKIERVSRVPYSSGSLFVRWNAGDTSPDTHGRTESEDIIRTEAIFDNYLTFNKKFSIKSSSKLLKPVICKFEVVWEPIGGKGVTIGCLNLDLSQFATPVGHHSSLKPLSFIDKDQKPVSGQSISYLLSQSRTNSLLTVSVRLDHLSGEKNFEIPEFDASAIRSYAHDRIDSNALHAEQNAKLAKGITKLKENVTDRILHTTVVNARNEDWFDFENFLQGNSERYVEPKEFQKFKQYSLKHPSFDTDSHKQGTPYMETEVRDSFITWKISS